MLRVHLCNQLCTRTLILELGKRLPKYYHPTVGTFSDAFSVDPAAIYMVYRNQYSLEEDQSLCQFVLADIDKVLDDIGQCDLEPVTMVGLYGAP